jgi:hypothetical protein
MRARRARFLAVLAVGVALATASCAQINDELQPAGTETRTDAEVAGDPATTVPAAAEAAVDELAPGLGPLADPTSRAAARDLIGQLRVAGQVDGGDYDRDRFGARWSDDTAGPLGHNGCDTRNDILARDLTGEGFRAGTHDCVVVSGTLEDPYTGETIAFVKSDADAVQIDHVVSLAAAWRMGAHRWVEAARQDFANDPLNLLAVDGPTNMAKGDSTPNEWLPPAQPAACSYSVRYATVSIRYDLAVEETDQAAMLAACA